MARGDPGWLATEEQFDDEVVVFNKLQKDHYSKGRWWILVWWILQLFLVLIIAHRSCNKILVFTRQLISVMVVGGIIWATRNENLPGANIVFVSKQAIVFVACWWANILKEVYKDDWPAALHNALRLDVLVFFVNCRTSYYGEAFTTELVAGVKPLTTFLELTDYVTCMLKNVQ